MGWSGIEPGPPRRHQRLMVWVSQSTTYGMPTGKQLTTLPMKDRLNMKMAVIRAFETSANIYWPNRRIHPRKLKFSSTSLTKKSTPPPHVMKSQDINSHDINLHYSYELPRCIYIPPFQLYSYIHELYSYKLPLYRYELRLHSNKFQLRTQSTIWLSTPTTYLHTLILYNELYSYKLPLHSYIQPFYKPIIQL
jgi:hypothetical protein